MSLLIINQSSSRIPRKFLQGWDFVLRKELKKRKVKNVSRLEGELVLVFMDPRPARELNKKYRSKNYATDVLSFESDFPGTLGELVICPEVIKKQSREHGLLQREELAYMMTHGVLHLLGYDHEQDEREARQMLTLQDQVFDVLLVKYRRGFDPPSSKA